MIRKIVHYAATLDELRELLSRDDKALREEFARDRAGAAADGMDRPIDRVSFVTSVIRKHFEVASSECAVDRYQAFADSVDDPTLAARLRSMSSTAGLFLSRRQCGEFIGCGYLARDEVRDLHVALAAYVDHPHAEIRVFASDLKSMYEFLISRASGDLFTVSGDESF